MQSTFIFILFSSIRRKVLIFLNHFSLEEILSIELSTKSSGYWMFVIKFLLNRLRERFVFSALSGRWQVSVVGCSVTRVPGN